MLLLASGATSCMAEIAAGPSSSLTREAPTGFAGDLRLGIGGSKRPEVGLVDFGGHARFRFDARYKEVGLGNSFGVGLNLGVVGARFRAGYSIAPLIKRDEHFGFSPFGAFAQSTIFICPTADCFESGRNRQTLYLLGTVGVDQRVHWRSTDFIFGSDAFGYALIGVGSHWAVKIF